MSSFRKLDPVVLLKAGVMTGTAVLHSAAMDIQSLIGASFQAVWTGTPTGTFILEGSNDNVTWTDIQAGLASAAGSGGSILANASWLYFKSIRLTYTNASGTGSLTVIGMAKGI